MTHNDPTSAERPEDHEPAFTFEGDTVTVFIDEDVKDGPELRMKSPPVIPIILHPDAMPGLDRKQG